MLQLVKYSDLKSMLSLEKETIDEYPSLKVLVESVYAAIESYVARRLEFGEYVEELWVNGRIVPLHALPIRTLTSVTIDGVALDPAFCTIRTHDILLPMRCSARVVVTYEGGLEETNGEYKRAMLLQVLHEWARRDNIGATNVSTEGGMTSWPELTLLKEVKRVLDVFVHPSRFV